MMIKLSFLNAVTWYVSFSIGLVLALWVLYNWRVHPLDNSTENFSQCPYCTYIFFHRSMTHDHDIRFPEMAKKEATTVHSKQSPNDNDSFFFIQCPRCHSFIQPDNNHQKKEGSNV